MYSRVLHLENCERVECIGRLCIRIQTNICPHMLLILGVDTCACIMLVLVMISTYKHCIVVIWEKKNLGPLSCRLQNVFGSAAFYKLTVSESENVFLRFPINSKKGKHYKNKTCLWHVRKVMAQLLLFMRQCYVHMVAGRYYIRLGT